MSRWSATSWPGLAARTVGTKGSSGVELRPGPASARQWRFLLPEPEGGPDRPAAVIGAAGDEVDALLTAGLATSVTTSAPPGGELACVVCLTGNEDRIEASFSAVREGGLLLAEVDRTTPAGRSLTPRRLRDAARRAGFEATGTWLVAPNVRRSRRYVPLDEPEALLWYLRSLYIPATVRTAVVRILGGVLARLGLMGVIGALAPSYCMVLRRGDSGRPEPAGLVPIVEQIGGGGRSLVLTSGRDAASRVILMPFPRGHRSPAAVVKVATLVSANGDTEAELVRLRQLRDRLPADTAAALPRPMASGRLGSLTVTAQTSAGGQAMDRSSAILVLGRLRRARDLRMAVRWATAFEKATTGDTLTWDGAASEQYVTGPLERVIADQRPADGEAVLAAVRSWCRRAAGTSVPLVAQHFDLAPFNIFLHRRALTVLDWELSAARHPTAGLPIDVLALVSYWLFQVRRVSTVAEEAVLLRELTELSSRGTGPVRTARRAVLRWRSELGIDREMIPVLHAALWLERAEYQRARANDLGIDPQGANQHADTAIHYLRTMAAGASP